MHAAGLWIAAGFEGIDDVKTKPGLGKPGRVGPGSSDYEPLNAVTPHHKGFQNRKGAGAEFGEVEG